MRPHFVPGGGDAHIFFKVHGSFRQMPEVSRTRHRCRGVPDGCDLRLIQRDSGASITAMGLEDDWIGREFRRNNPALERAVQVSEQCLVLLGEIADPLTLDYLRDAVGLIMALLDGGGVGVFDPHTFNWWSSDQWRARMFDPCGAVPQHHVDILVSDDEEPDQRWYHTRGMLKFGRPDLSVHHVVQSQYAGVEDMLGRFVEFQALGGVIAEGQAIRMQGLPSNWTCHHAGDLGDPDFNNRHVEIGSMRPAPVS